MVQIGGFTPFNDLNPDDRRQMYELERANFVARRVMGVDRYLNVIRQQNQGVARGEDTDWLWLQRQLRVKQLRMILQLNHHKDFLLKLWILFEDNSMSV